MTRDEAIQFLDNMKHAEAGRAIGKEGFYAELLGYHIQALNMAIKALEQQTCEDAVGRQFMKEMGATCIAKRNENELIPIIAIDALPSVNPQPKIGHWIQTKEKNDAEPFILWECSCCHKEFRGVVHKVSNYCPNCGARMVERSEE